jgi:hypothetical protein
VVLTLFPLGLLSFGAFLYTGLRARQRRWVVAAVVYAVVVYTGFVLTASTGARPSRATWVSRSS